MSRKNESADELKRTDTQRYYRPYKGCTVKLRHRSGSICVRNQFAWIKKTYESVAKNLYPAAKNIGNWHLRWNFRLFIIFSTYSFSTNTYNRGKHVILMFNYLVKTKKVETFSLKNIWGLFSSFERLLRLLCIISIPNKWIVLLVRAYWLARRWLYNYINLRASSGARNSKNRSSFS